MDPILSKKFVVEVPVAEVLAMVPQGGEGAVVGSSLVVELVAVLRGGSNHGQNGGGNELKWIVVSSGKTRFTRNRFIGRGTSGIVSDRKPCARQNDH